MPVAPEHKEDAVALGENASAAEAAAAVPNGEVLAAMGEGESSASVPGTEAGATVVAPRSNVLCLGMQYITTAQYDQIQCTAAQPKRDLIRIRSLEKRGFDVFTVSHPAHYHDESGTRHMEEGRHVWGNFCRGEKFINTLKSEFAGVTFKHIIMDYFRMPSAYCDARFSESFYRDTIALARDVIEDGGDIILPNNPSVRSGINDAFMSITEHFYWEFIYSLQNPLSEATHDAKAELTSLVSDQPIGLQQAYINETWVAKLGDPPFIRLVRLEESLLPYMPAIPKPRKARVAREPAARRNVAEEDSSSDDEDEHAAVPAPKLKYETQTRCEGGSVYIGSFKTLEKKEAAKKVVAEWRKNSPGHTAEELRQFIWENIRQKDNYTNRKRTMPSLLRHAKEGDIEEGDVEEGDDDDGDGEGGQWSPPPLPKPRRKKKEQPVEIDPAFNGLAVPVRQHLRTTRLQKCGTRTVQLSERQQLRLAMEASAALSRESSSSSVTEPDGAVVSQAAALPPKPDRKKAAPKAAPKPLPAKKKKAMDSEYYTDKNSLLFRSNEEIKQEKKELEKFQRKLKRKKMLEMVREEKRHEMAQQLKAMDLKDKDNGANTGQSHDDDDQKTEFEGRPDKEAESEEYKEDDPMTGAAQGGQAPPFVCPHHSCNKQYWQEASLGRHRKQKHGTTTTATTTTTNTTASGKEAKVSIAINPIAECLRPPRSPPPLSENGRGGLFDPPAAMSRKRKAPQMFNPALPPRKSQLERDYWDIRVKPPKSVSGAEAHDGGDNNNDDEGRPMTTTATTATAMSRVMKTTASTGMKRVKKIHVTPTPTTYSPIAIANDDGDDDDGSMSWAGDDDDHSGSDREHDVDDDSDDSDFNGTDDAPRAKKGKRGAKKLKAKVKATAPRVSLLAKSAKLAGKSVRSFLPPFLPSVRPSFLYRPLSSFLPSLLVLPSFLPSFLYCMTIFLPSFLPSSRPSFRPSYRPSLHPSFRPPFRPHHSFLPSSIPSFLAFVLILPSFRKSEASDVGSDGNGNGNGGVVSIFLPSFLPSFFPFFLHMILPSLPSYNPSFLNIVLPSFLHIFLHLFI
jgi:hypothetical protein